MLPWQVVNVWAQGLDASLWEFVALVVGVAGGGVALMLGAFFLRRRLDTARRGPVVAAEDGQAHAGERRGRAGAR